jgi:DNA-binding transcriptional LysR family regulator
LDRFEAMSVLLVAVETGSFSAASRKLDIPLSTVSRKISDLESHLGTRLLVRNTRNLTLTENGNAYLAACRRILDDVTDAERKVAGEYLTPRGDLVLTAPLIFGRLYILPIVNAFLSRYPDINIKLVLTDRNIHLVDDQIDIALRIGDLPDSSMVATKLGTLSRVTCASPAFLAAQGVPKVPSDVSTMPCITMSILAGGPKWIYMMADAKREVSVPIRCRLEVNSADAAVQAAVAGVGVVQLLSYQAAEAVAAGKLRIILRKFERTSIPVNLVHAGQSLLPIKTRVFLEYATPKLRKSLTI